MKNLFGFKILGTLLFVVLVNGSLQASNGGTADSIAYMTADSSLMYVPSLSALGGFYFPIKGKLISHYGRRGRGRHSGSDVKSFKGDSVKAGFDGLVVKASRYHGYGILVVIKHPAGYETYYAHLSKALVNEGDSVKAGTPVGLEGRTGRATTEHLHFELRNNGKALNPEHFFDFNNQTILAANIPVAKQPESKLSNSSDKIVKGKKSKYHVVKRNDTLYSLAKKNGTTVKTICKLNKITPNTKLKIGTKLLLR